MEKEKYTCPVCGKHEFDDEFSLDVCPVCNWINDINDERDETVYNKYSLEEARKYYKEHGKLINNEFKKVDFPDPPTGKHLCPVCLKHTFEYADDEDICPVCKWINDWYDEYFHDEDGGINSISLDQAKENYKRYGISELRCRNTIMDDLQDWLIDELAVPEGKDILIYEPEYPQTWTEAMRLKFKFAVNFAAMAHKGVVRKGTTIPYVLHPVEAALIVLGMTDDLDVVLAAVLHDIIEDTRFDQNDIELLFGKKVAEFVASESEDKRENRPASETWKERKEETIQHIKAESIEAKMICLGDKLSNIRMSVKTHKEKGDAMWECFNQSNPDMQAWYYDSIAEALDDLKEQPYWQEYVQCCDQVFRGNDKILGVKF